MKEEIFSIITDAIAVGYDSYTELLGFCKGLEVLGRKDLAEGVMGLYKSHASDSDTEKFINENF